MDEVLEKMLNRVRALLAKAEDDGATPEEADALTAKAAELMARYNIDAVMLAAKADKREVPVDRVVKFPDPYAKQHMTLYFHILKAFGGDAVVIEHHRRGRRNTVHGTTLHVYAFEADLMAVDVLYTSLLFQGINRSKVVPPYEHARTWRVSFWTAFAAEIYSMLTGVQGKAADSTGVPGTAIVLRDRKALVQAKLQTDHPKVHTYASSKCYSQDGVDAGRAAARSANLHNTTQTGGATRTALVG